MTGTTALNTQKQERTGEQQMTALSAAEHTRLRTWVIEIAEALLPTGAQRQDRGGDWRFANTGGLSIAKRSGAWFSHAASVGGYSTLRLIELLRSCEHAEAEQWAAAWLASHPGTGSCDGAADDAADSQAATQANAARAKAVIAAVVPPADTIAEAYLRSRGIAPPYPDCVRFLPDARIGESALVGLLTAHDVVIGAQLTYLDPAGRKSLCEPVRQTFVLDRERAKGAVFVVEKLSSNGRLLLAEGLEDGLSLQACARPEAIFALPGIGGLQHFPARRGQAISVVRDGDEPDSAADKALIEGVDHLLAQHAEVRVTVTPSNADANGILQAEGTDALNVLVDAAVAAELSREGEVKRLARLADPADYDKERVRIADKFGMRLATLDAKVIKAKPRPRKGKDEAVAGAAGNGLVLREPEPWPDAVRLADVLQALKDRLEQHLFFAHPAYSTLLSLWVAHTYVFAAFQFTPRLAIDSPQPRCGKTTLDGILELTAHRPVPADGLTPASLVRLKEATGNATVLLDEMADALAASPELDQVLRSGFQNGRRYIRLQPQPDGTFVHESFDVFQPVAISLVGSLRGALADRAIHIHMRRKSRSHQLAKLRQANNRAVLLDLGRQLARWAEDDGDALAEPTDIPEALNDRQGDFVAPLLAIADQAGGSWPQHARHALVQVLTDSNPEDDAIRLLGDIHAVFEADLAARPDVLPDEQEMEGALLVGRLLQLLESPWAHPETGRPLTQHKLASLLRPFHIVPGNVGPESHRKRGYRRLQFTQSWAAYLSMFLPDPPVQSAQPVQNGGISPDSGEFQSAQDGSAVHSEIHRKPAEFCEPAQAVHSVHPPLGENIKESPAEAKYDNHGGKDFMLYGRIIHPVPSAMEQAIRDLARTHPHWTESRLAKAAKQPVARVRKALNGAGTDSAVPAEEM